MSPLITNNVSCWLANEDIEVHNLNRLIFCSMPIPDSKAPDSKPVSDVVVHLLFSCPIFYDSVILHASPCQATFQGALSSLLGGHVSVKSVHISTGFITTDWLPEAAGFVLIFSWTKLALSMHCGSTLLMNLHFSMLRLFYLLCYVFSVWTYYIIRVTCVTAIEWDADFHKAEKAWRTSWWDTIWQDSEYRSLLFFLHPHLIFFLVTSLKNSMNILQIDFLFLGLMFMWFSQKHTRNECWQCKFLIQSANWIKKWELCLLSSVMQKYIMNGLITKLLVSTWRYGVWLLAWQS